MKTVEGPRSVVATAPPSESHVAIRKGDWQNVGYNWIGWRALLVCDKGPIHQRSNQLFEEMFGLGHDNPATFKRKPASKQASKR